MMKRGPPWGCRGRAGEEEDFCEEMGAQDDGPEGTGESNPAWAVCARAEGREPSPDFLDLCHSSPPSQPFC